ncbi:hypothetical protein Vadar_007091 [Vaccinium darrowii]|uniref:Uncharacterized protein n=1 Tax=Vaccinium darrowii TaxID=229202 RepID=A0ACB7XQ63_9ERIC|nr:hypothetical protein Vadar_007091 [Vaccinium darrowii]
MITFNDDEPIVAIPDDSGNEDEETIRDGKTSLRIIKKNEAPLEESKFKVMLELTGAGSGNDRRGLDLVMVLDVSGSMDGDKLKKMIITTRFVIKKLSPIDRLSIVTFAENSKRLCPLRQITEHSQTEIENLVNALVSNGGTNIAAGFQTGLQVLNDRSLTSGRAVCIMLMSNGLQTDGDATKVPVGKVPVHTFGYGQDHDPKRSSSCDLRFLVPSYVASVLTLYWSNAAPHGLGTLGPAVDPLLSLAAWLSRSGPVVQSSGLDLFMGLTAQSRSGCLLEAFVCLSCTICSRFKSCRPLSSGLSNVLLPLDGCLFEFPIDKRLRRALCLCLGYTNPLSFRDLGCSPTLGLGAYSGPK